VLHISRLGGQDHILGDVRGVVGHALQVLGNQHEVHALRAGFRVLRNLLNGGAHHLVLVAIHLVVVAQHPPGQLGVVPLEALDGAAQLELALLAQFEQALRRAGGISGAKAHGGFGDVAGQVAHPLEVVGHHLARHHAAQIVGHRRLGGEQVQHPLVNLDIHAIYGEIVLQHLLRGGCVALPDCRQGLLQNLLGESRHAQQLAAQFAEHEIHGARHRLTRSAR